MIFCPNCNKLTGYKRSLGFGTFFAVVFTAGFWLLTVPFYTKRCITCGLAKTDSVPWQRTWRGPALVALVGTLAAYFLLPVIGPTRPSKQRPPIVENPRYSELATSTVTDSSPNHRVVVDARAVGNELQFVRSIEGMWSKPTLIYSDDEVKVYMPFDDQLTLSSSSPERNWSSTSFEVLIFTDCRVRTWRRARAVADLKVGGIANPEGLSYTEERVVIDTANLKYTVSSRQAIDASGESMGGTAESWSETRDLSDPQYKTRRFITGEIARRLTAPQRIALDALGVHSLNDLRGNHELEQHYVTLMKDQATMQRGLGPEQ